MPDPIAFMSYAQSDDREGRLTRFREQLSQELRAQTGKEFAIFQDRNDILWGQSWKERISDSIDATTFLIPIVTPSFFASEACRKELQRFIGREQELRRNDLILPLYYIQVAELEDATKPPTDELMQAIRARQWVDWRQQRFRPFDNASRRLLAKLAAQIRDALERVESAQVTPPRPSETALATSRSEVPRSLGSVSHGPVQRPLRVFLCHSSGDKPRVRTLYDRLVRDGFDPWLDEKKLLPGQRWSEEIPKAVRLSDVILVCMSKSSIDKAGYLQREIRLALDVAEEQPESSIFLIPAKFEECDVPDRLRYYQWANLYDEQGYEQLLQSLRVRIDDVRAKG